VSAFRALADGAAVTRLRAPSRVLVATRGVVAIVATAAAGHALACGESLGNEVKRVDNPRYSVVYRSVPAPVAVGQHFAVDFAVCPKAGATAPREVRVDANMPAHKHGMNYRTTVVRARDGTYRAEGLLFHMPGRWDLTFDVVAGSNTERLASTLDVR